jgi:hypothetical protein
MRLAAIVSSLLLPLASPAAAVEKPALSTTSSETRIVVRGAHFVANERVTVRVIGRTIVTKRTVTTARGSFRLALRRPAPRACNTLVVRATGSRGDWALLRIGSLECNPPGGG